jgi:hypothetical protein
MRPLIRIVILGLVACGILGLLAMGLASRQTARPPAAAA